MKKNKVKDGSVIINEKEYKIPQSWKDISTEKYLNLRAIEGVFDEARFLSIMIDCPLKEILKNQDPDFEYDVFRQLEWYRTKPLDPENLLIPTHVKFGGKEMTVPVDIGYKTYGQKIALQERLKVSAEEDPISLIPQAIAIYFYNEYTGTEDIPDDDVLDAFAKEHCMSMPITVSYPLGYFFLLKFVESMTSKLKVLEENILPRRRKRKFINWRSLANLRSSTPLQGVIFSNTEKS